MYPVSAAFLTACRNAHQTVTATAHLADGTTLNISSGSVELDDTRDTLRTATLTLNPGDGIATARDLYDRLATPGIEVHIARGILLPNGSTETVPLGVFTTTSLRRTADGTTVEWAGVDRSATIAANRWLDPYRITRGTDLAGALVALLRDRWPQLRANVGNVAGTLGAGLVLDAGAESDPWADAQQIARDHGYRLGFDGAGVLTARVVAAAPTAGTAVFDWGGGTGGEPSLVLDVSTEIDLSATYNGVVASGEGSEVAAPVRGIVWDTNPKSPTYYLGPAGRRPYFYSSPLLASVAQCELAAATMLPSVLRRSSAVTLTGVPMPALEPGDVVSVAQGVLALDRSRPGVRFDTTEVFDAARDWDDPYGLLPDYAAGTEERVSLLVERVTVPLDVGGTMSVSGRVV